MPRWRQRYLEVESAMGENACLFADALPSGRRLQGGAGPLAIGSKPEGNVYMQPTFAVTVSEGNSLTQ